MADLGGWICSYCHQMERHLSTCPAPSGRCRLCGAPLDIHKNVDRANIMCPALAR